MEASGPGEAPAPRDSTVAPEDPEDPEVRDAALGNDLDQCKAHLRQEKLLMFLLGHQDDNATLLRLLLDDPDLLTASTR